ncbi:MAG TPA: hypothetical protein DCZ30_07525, partial [Clostridiales bacterium]|nr:hypothetical protein [Clostridiales bacterium]
MKKWILYSIIAILLIISISSIILLIISYNDTKGSNMKSIDKFAEVEDDYISKDTEIITTSYSSTKVSPDAILSFNTYYKGCGHTIKEEKNAEEDIINKNEQDIILIKLLL